MKYHFKAFILANHNRKCGWTMYNMAPKFVCTSMCTCIYMNVSTYYVYEVPPYSLGATLHVCTMKKT